MRYIVLIVILFCSCSSVKEMGALNSYIENLGTGEMTVVKEKSDVSNILDIIKGRGTIDTLTGEFIPRYGGRDPLYNINDWLVLERIAKAEAIPEFWDEKDFRKKDIVLQTYDEIWSKRKIYTVKRYDVYQFSQPLFYKGKEYVVFHSLVRMFPMYTLRENCVVVMKREKGKWTVVHKIYQNEIIE